MTVGGEGGRIGGVREGRGASPSPAAADRLRRYADVRRYEATRYASADQRLIDRRERRLVQRWLLGLEGGGVWLDLPCGYGRLTELLVGPGREPGHWVPPGREPEHLVPSGREPEHLVPPGRGSGHPGGRVPPSAPAGVRAVVAADLLLPMVERARERLAGPGAGTAASGGGESLLAGASAAGAGAGTAASGGGEDLGAGTTVAGGGEDLRAGTTAAGARATAPLFCAADLLSLPFRDGAFEGALLFRLLQHFSPERRRVALGEIARVTTRWVLLSAYTGAPLHRAVRRLQGRDRKIHPRRRLERELAAAGLRVVRRRKILPGLHAQTIYLLSAS